MCINERILIHQWYFICLLCLSWYVCLLSEHIFETFINKEKEVSIKKLEECNVNLFYEHAKQL